MRAPWTVTLAFVTTLASTAAADEGLQKGPYLQHLTSSSVDVRVELVAPAPVSVDVAPESAPDARASAPRTSPRATFHSVHLAGLTAATRYRYAVHVGAAVVRGSFVTAPPDDSHDPFTFIVYGDNRSDGAAHARVVRAMARESFDFLVHTGDFVIAGDDDSAWKSFFDVEAPILRDHSVFACVGNHELTNDREAAHFERYFGPTEPTSATAPPPIYGSFRWGRARFFLLNAFTDWVAGPERAWLDAALTRADTEAGLDLRVAVMHQGPYSAGPHGSDTDLLAAHIDELLTSHHVDLVVAGHDHIYERGEAHGLKYIISGGGGAPLYREISPLPSTRRVEATYNFVLATVNDAGVSVVAKRADGSLIEQCSFARGAAWQCDHPKVGATPPVARPAPTPSPARGGCGCRIAGAPPPTGGRLGSFLGAVLAVLTALRRRHASLRLFAGRTS